MAGPGATAEFERLNRANVDAVTAYFARRVYASYCQAYSQQQDKLRQLAGRRDLEPDQVEELLDRIDAPVPMIVAGDPAQSPAGRISRGRFPVAASGQTRAPSDSGATWAVKQALVLAATAA